MLLMWCTESDHMIDITQGLLEGVSLLQEADFYMYSLYSKNKPKSDDVMAECGSVYFAVSSVKLIVTEKHSRKSAQEEIITTAER